MMMSTLPRLAFAAAAATIGASVAVCAENPGPHQPTAVMAAPPAATPPGAAPAPAAPGKVPPFLKVDGMYLLDGNEDDFVKVLEISETGWMRVQTKGGESWVNISSLTTIVPISKEQADKSELHAKADFILDGAQQISDAIDAYAAKNNLPPTASFKWMDIRKFLKQGTPVYDSNGKDVDGRPYEFGAKISDHVKVNADTIKALDAVIDDPDAYWGKFKP